VNRDKFVPNPSFDSPKQLSMFEFVGKLIGINLRNKGNFPLNLPSIFWKSMVGEPLDRSDLEAIDFLTCQSLSTLLNIEKEGVTESTFNDVINFPFTTYSSDGREVELIDGGSNIYVGWKDRKIFVSLVEQYKIEEFQRQIAAIIKGMTSLVPPQLAYILTWRELELCICGRPDIDLKILKEHTEYRGFTDSEPLIAAFWEVMEGFSAEERSLFLKFVWGRSRLPSVSADFKDNFLIQPFTKKEGNPDDYLPEAHTCFFSLDLPRYSSKEVLKEKLTYAIYNCKAIDTDFNVHDDNDDDF